MQTGRYKSISIILLIAMVICPVSVFAKKGEKSFKRGLDYEKSQEWTKAVQEYAQAIASNPSDTQYQLHYRRAAFNASQLLIKQSQTLKNKGDYTGAYNSLQQAHIYDPNNKLAQVEMEQLLTLLNNTPQNTTPVQQTASSPPQSTDHKPVKKRSLSAEKLRVIKYTDVEMDGIIKTLAREIKLNVVFDSSLQNPKRRISLDLENVSAAQALDLIFLSNKLFFQKVQRGTILVTDAQNRPYNQQLSVQTFYLANTDLLETQKVIQTTLGQQAGGTITITTNKLTNSLTVRTTPQNMRLVADIIKSLDKDRAEVVIDVNIYEVLRSDLLKFGNQLSTQLSKDGPSGLLGGSTGLSVLAGGRKLAEQGLPLPTALGAALAIPASRFMALQEKTNTRVLASTQIHAFDNEKTNVNIGQRVPVETAQTSPGLIGINTSQQNNNSGFGLGGGVEVINYEQVGLKLQFTPSVYPNLDVQVNMSIESIAVAKEGIRPTFTNRSITGTARIQNNQTMMIASVSTRTEEEGKSGLPLIGLIPILGRLVTAPQKSNHMTDIVITVTPRVIRAPQITPSDKEMRPSGTLAAPASESIESLMEEENEEKSLALG
jgi:general secretion pathway protein D